MADGYSSLYILIRVQEDASDRVAQRLKKEGFNVHVTGGINSPFDIIIFFDASNEKLGDLRA